MIQLKKELTDWELGNDIMCNVVDKMRELSDECSNTNPAISKLLLNISLDFGTLVNDLMCENSPNSSQIRMCPEHISKDEDTGEVIGVYSYFDGSSIYKKDKEGKRL